MHTAPKLLAVWIAAASAACSVEPVTFTLPGIVIGGTITGLDGTGLVLTNNGGDDLAVTGDGAFAFPTPLERGSSYALAVKQQPSGPTQLCSIANAAGVAGEEDVVDVQVTCATRAFQIGGTVTGLLGAGLALTNNGGDELEIAADGGFTFATPVASGAPFEVAVATQPRDPAQTCTVAGGAGVVGGGDVTSVTINCATNAYTIGGTITGLAGAVTLRNNGADEVTLTANGTFAFPTPIPSGGTYAVTVAAQPTTPSQTCVVAAGAGTVTDAAVTSVAITCTTNRYSVGGTLSGLAAGNSLRLRNNGADELLRTANGGFVFPTTVPSGQTYAVTVVANPSTPISQTCAVASGAGTIGGADVTNVGVTCTTNTFTIGGAVSGLTGAGLVLRNNGGNDLPISGNGPFTFTAPVASGGAYNVTVRTQPAGQACTVTSGAGTVGASNVTSVDVKCGTVWPASLFPMPMPGAGFGVGDLALDGNGDLLVVVSSPANAIVRVNRASSEQTTIASGIGAGTLLGVAYRAANDTIYASTESQIFAVTQGGAVSPLATVTSLNAITIAPPSFGAFGGFLIGVTQAGSVIAVNPVGGAVTTITAAAGAASDLAFAPDGTLYISGGASVRTVTAAGAVATFAAGFSAADGIAIAPDGGRMFIADSNTDTVLQVTIPGAVITPLGTADIDSGFFVGGIVAAPGNRLIVMTGESSLTLVGFSY